MPIELQILKLCKPDNPDCLFNVYHAIQMPFCKVDPVPHSNDGHQASTFNRELRVLPQKHSVHCTLNTLLYVQYFQLKGGKIVLILITITVV